MSLDFTLSKYRELCQAILAAGYSVCRIDHYLTNHRNSNVVLLRHDVDRFPGSALQMASLEQKLGLQATYYFRMTRSAFRPALLKEIVSMGHEIGYHYETLTKARGDVQRAIALFEEELTRFRQICRVRTISMHGAPFSPYDNRDLWQHCDFREYGVVGEAYLSLDYGRLVYLTDTGRSWDSGLANVRDKVAQDWPVQDLSSTDALASAIRDRHFDQMCISVHPERWAGNILEWMVSAVTDLAVNQAKVVVGFCRRRVDNDS